MAAHGTCYIVLTLLLSAVGGCISNPTVDADDSAGSSVSMPTDPHQTSWPPVARMEGREGTCEEAPLPLPVFPGYTDAQYQMWDEMFQQEADLFNRTHGFVPGDTGFLDASLLKSWAIQESGSLWGSGAEEWRSGDILRVNVPGNWNSSKLHVLGIERDQSLNPRESVRAAIAYAYHKACLYRPIQRIPMGRMGSWETFTRFHRNRVGDLVPETVPGVRRYFVGWKKALYAYNGNRRPANSYRPEVPLFEPDGTIYEMREYYVDSILGRLASGFIAEGR